MLIDNELAIHRSFLSCGGELARKLSRPLLRFSYAAFRAAALATVLIEVTIRLERAVLRFGFCAAFLPLLWAAALLVLFSSV
ncbi:MAG: hypothetical protein H0W76_29530, partial [Pyrinomonadaceae bacterium]|nr:hypothetical protein [Pyrinomonadaceae bacterium]